MLFVGAFYVGEIVEIILEIMESAKSKSPQECIYEEIRNSSDLTKLNTPMGREFLNYNNHRIHIRSHWPKDEKTGESVVPKAIIVLVHGYASHINRPPHSYLRDFYASHNIAYITFDTFGHGYSTGTKALVLPGEELTNLVLKVVNLCYSGPIMSENHFFDKPKDGVPVTVPLFLMGHSMGGAVALLSAFKLRQAGINFQGCVLLCPALIVAEPPLVVRWAVDNVIAPLFPTACIPASMSTFKDPHDTWLSDDYIRYLEADRFPVNPEGLLWGGEMRYATASHLLALCNQAVKSIPFVTHPFVVLHDPEDKITPMAGSRLLFEQSGTDPGDKQVIELTGGAHDLFINRLDEVAVRSVAWIESRLLLA